jgi:hypothetical protein
LLSLRRRVERKEQLNFGKRFSAATEAMALQFLDDLHKPLGSDALGDQHRLERLRIVGERVDGLRHGPK